MLVMLGAVLFLLGASVFLGAGLLWAFMQADEYREPRSVWCPETQQPADVQVDGELAAATTLRGREIRRLLWCSRWPERRDCDQACAAQVALVGDSRSTTPYAPFGLHPRYLRIHRPVRMTRELYNRVASRK